jgi:hypothetical protein
MRHEFSTGARVTPYDERVYHSVARKHLRDTRESSGSNIDAKYMSIQYLNEDNQRLAKKKVLLTEQDNIKREREYFYILHL